MVQRSIEIEGPLRLPSELNAIANDVISTYKAASLRALKGYRLPRGASFERSFIKLWNKSSRTGRSVIRKKILAMEKNRTVLRRHLGAYASISLARPESLYVRRPSTARLANEIRVVQKLKVDKNYYAKKFLGLYHLQIPPASVRYCNRRVQFKLDKVKCIDETGWDWTGSDEIDMGGTSVDALGVTRKINKWRVSSDFDTGETKNYRPDRTISTFDVTQGGNVWPKVYTVMLSMAEIDNGGFSDFLDEVWKLTKSYVKGKITAAGAAIGTAIGGPLGAAIGALIGWIASKVVDWIVGWIISSFKDDMIDTKKWTLIHNGPCALFNGSRKSTTRKTKYRGGGGKYDTYTYWVFS